MPTLNIEGRRVKVDDSFMSLSPEQQSATVDEIASSFSKAPIRQDAAPEAAPVADPAAPPVDGPSRTSAALLGAADTGSLGFGDELGAGLGAASEYLGSLITGAPARSYSELRDAMRTQEKTAQEAHPGYFLGGQVAGGFALPGGAAKGVGGAIRNGAIAGGAYGFGSGEGGFENRRDAALLGGAAGGAVGGAVHGIANALTTRAAKSAIPTNEVIKKASQEAYDAADKAGVIIRPQASQRLSTALKTDLADFGYDTALHPGISAVLSRVDDLASQNTTLKGLDIVRRVARSAAADFNNPSQQALAGKIIDHIDDFAGKLQPTDVLAGDAKAAANSMMQARSLWGRMRKSEMVDEAVQKAEHRTGSTGTGGNSDNVLRQNIRGILDNKKKASGFTASERKAMERVVMGTPIQNSLRLAGRLSPRGNGLMAGLGLGGVMANPAVTIPTMIGADIAKRVADRATPANVERLSQIIRSGGLSAKEIAKQAKNGIGSRELLAAVARYRSLEKKSSTAAATLAAAVLNGTILNR